MEGETSGDRWNRVVFPFRQAVFKTDEVSTVYILRLTDKPQKYSKPLSLSVHFCCGGRKNKRIMPGDRAASCPPPCLQYVPSLWSSHTHGRYKSWGHAAEPCLPCEQRHPKKRHGADSRHLKIWKVEFAVHHRRPSAVQPCDPQP